MKKIGTLCKVSLFIDPRKGLVRFTYRGPGIGSMDPMAKSKLASLFGQSSKGEVRKVRKALHAAGFRNLAGLARAA